jgi:hypothetical protein
MLQQAVHHPSSSGHRQADPAPGQRSAVYDVLHGSGQ